MLNAISRNGILGFWFGGVVVTAVVVMAMGVSVAVSTTALLLTMSLVPPAILLLVWRETPPTVGEILYSANARKEGRS